MVFTNVMVIKCDVNYLSQNISDHNTNNFKK